MSDIEQSLTSRLASDTTVTSQITDQVFPANVLAQEPVHLPARANIEVGQAVWVVGKLVVVRHPPGGGVVGFTEIRIESARILE